MKGWNKISIEKIKALPGVRSVKELPTGKTMQEPNGRIVSKHFKQRSAEKDWIAWNLLIWCNERTYQLLTEYRFNADRKWRFDYFIPALKVGIEYNGIISEKSRHTTVKGYTGDMEKLNSAQALGFKVLQFTPLNYKTLITELNKHL